MSNDLPTLEGPRDLPCPVALTLLAEAYKINSGIVQVLNALDVPDGRRKTAEAAICDALALNEAIAAYFPQAIDTNATGGT